MENLQVFTNDDFGDIRVIEKNGEPLFVAADVCRALGITNSRDAVVRLDNDEKNTVVLTDGIRGNPNVTAVTESGLYSIVLGSRKPEAKIFKRWITHEVIPSIRKHGAYATPQTIESIIADPAFAIKLLEELQKEKEERIAAETECVEQKKLIEELTPKGTYYDVVLSAINAIPITLIAKDYGLSARALNEILHDLRIQYKSGDSWVLYQDYINKGYTKSYTAIDKYGHKAKMQLNWTQSGRLFIYETLKHKMGLLPICELHQLSA